MRFKIQLLIFLGFAALWVNSCNQNSQSYNSASAIASQGTFVVDESFKPIVDEELYVFKSLYPKMNPKVLYAPEANAVNLFFNDSVRVAILSRDFTKQEYKQLQQKNSNPKIMRFAIDAVALIVNSESTDTLITLSNVKKMLNGDIKTDRNIVFDNPNSGLVRYLKELSGSSLKQKNIFSLKSNKEVIKYVSTHTDAIGITGFSWLNDPDKDYADAVNQVKIMSVKDDIGKNASANYYSPSQNTLALKQYPLSRDLYIIYSTSKLGLEFASFITNDQGQRIILKSGLLPDDIPGREIVIQKKIKISDK